MQTPKLQWAELYYASTLARWSGLCYKPADQLADAVKVNMLQSVSMVPHCDLRAAVLPTTPALAEPLGRTC